MTGDAAAAGDADAAEDTTAVAPSLRFLSSGRMAKKNKRINTIFAYD